METGSDSSDLVEVIEVDGPDAEDDVAVYEGWVRSCPHLRPLARAELLARAVAVSPPIARAELLARAVAAIGNHPAAPAVILSLQYCQVSGQIQIQWGNSLTGNCNILWESSKFNVHIQHRTP